jgi:PP-loop superfamily ATP-utilizing enzyme
MRWGRTSNGYFFPKRYVRKVRARRRAQFDMFEWQREQQQQRVRKLADANVTVADLIEECGVREVAEALIDVVGIERCREALQ